MEIKQANKVFDKPIVIQRLGNNNYLYNYIVSQTKSEQYNENTKQTESKDCYEVITVKLAGVPNYKDCVQAIIRSYVTQNEEFDLINTANKINLKIEVKDSDKDKYVNYLKLVDMIKEKVKSDFSE